MAIKFDARQTISRDLLDQLVTATDEQLDTILSSINSELIPPLRLSASSPADLTITVDSIFVQNTQTGRNKTIPSISNTLPNFTGGTVVIPSTSGGTVTVTPGTNSTLTLSPGNFIKMGISLDTSGNMSVQFGTAGATVDAATVPPAVNNTFSIGYVVLENVAGTIQNVENSDIFQFAGGGGSGSVTALDDVGDVVITANSSGEVLAWNGTNWVNRTLSEIGASATGHTHPASSITTGTFDDARISESSVTQHEAALSIDASQIVGDASGINFVKNPTADNLSDLTTSNATVTAETSDALRIEGAQSFKIVPTTPGTSSSLVEWNEDTIPDHYDGANFVFDVRVNFATLNGTTWRFGIYDNNASDWVDGSYQDVTVEGKYHIQKLHSISDASAGFEPRLERTAGTGADVIYADVVKHSPDVPVIGESIPRTEWADASSLVKLIEGTGTSNTPSFLSGGSEDWVYRRDGENMFIRGTIVAGAAGSGILTSNNIFVKLLTNTLTLSKMPGNSGNIDNVYGTFMWRDDGTKWELGVLQKTNSDTELQLVVSGTGLSALRDGDVAASDRIGLEIGPIPIAEWPDRETRFGTNSDVEYVSHDGSSIVVGESGAVIPTSTPSGTSEINTITSAFSKTFKHYGAEVQPSGTGPWMPVDDNIDVLRSDGTNFIGFGVYADGTDIFLARGKYRNGVTNTWSGIPAGTRWRVWGSDNPLGIGVPSATSERAGTISRQASDSGEGTLGGIVNWASPGSKLYRWRQIGDVVHLWVRIDGDGGSDSANINNINWDLPSDVPEPDSSMFSSVGNSEFIVPATAHIGGGIDTRAGILKDASGWICYLYPVSSTVVHYAVWYATYITST